MLPIKTLVRYAETAFRHRTRQVLQSSRIRITSESNRISGDVIELSNIVSFILKFNNYRGFPLSDFIDSYPESQGSLL